MNPCANLHLAIVLNGKAMKPVFGLEFKHLK